MPQEELPFELNPVILDKDKHGAFSLEERLRASPNDASVNLTPKELKMQSEIEVVKKQASWVIDQDNIGIDFWFWQLEGESTIKEQDDNGKIIREVNLKKSDCILIPTTKLGSISTDVRGDNAQLLKVCQNPKLK